MTNASRPEILALIPARGGSKGIPRKNLLPIMGQPLIAYSIAQALASRWITRVIVSTDDEEIAQVARAHGAEVPFMRPAEYAQDHSLDVDVFRHALATLEADEHYTCEAVVHLRPTGPIRQVARIDEAIALFLAHPDADSLRSVTVPTHTPYKMWRRDGEWLVPLLDVPGVDEPFSHPRQALPKVLWQNGYVDIIRPRVILDGGGMAGQRVLAFEMDEPILELDYPENIPAIESALRGGTRGAGSRHSS
jgi:N-acylneuraminate cytidylyltransferase